MTARSRRWFLAVLLFTTVVSASLLLLPLSTEQTVGPTEHRRTLLAGEGPGVILALTVPVLVCAAPLLAPPRYRRAAAWGSAAALALGVVVSLLSVGVFFVPSVILLAVGAGRRKS